MPRPRTNDSLGVSDNPDCATDPQVIAQRVAELSKCLKYASWHFRMGQKFMNAAAFNSSLADLKRALKSKKAKGGPRRLNPQLEMALAIKACEFAEQRGCGDDACVTKEDKQRAAEWVAKKVRAISNRPSAEFLRGCVEGVMALLQEYSGKPVLCSRTRNSVYEPHFKPGMSRIIPELFMRLDPSITETQLVNIVLQARRKYAGRKMHFRNFFPGYGATVGVNGELIVPGLQIEKFGLNFPAYCP